MKCDAMLWLEYLRSGCIYFTKIHILNQDKECNSFFNFTKTMVFCEPRHTVNSGLQQIDGQIEMPKNLNLYAYSASCVFLVPVQYKHHVSEPTIHFKFIRILP